MDVLLLADVFENFVVKSTLMYGINTSLIRARILLSSTILQFDWLKISFLVWNTNLTCCMHCFLFAVQEPH